MVLVLVVWRRDGGALEARKPKPPPPKDSLTIDPRPHPTHPAHSPKMMNNHPHERDCDMCIIFSSPFTKENKLTMRIRQYMLVGSCGENFLAENLDRKFLVENICGKFQVELCWLKIFGGKLSWEILGGKLFVEIFRRKFGGKF